MHIVRPIDFTLSAISESENDAPVWLSTTTYSIGSSVMQNGLIYVSTINNNLALDPSLEVQELTGARWLLRGATNVRKFMDDSISTKTVGTSPLVIDVEVSGRFNSIAMFGLDGSETTVDIISNGVSTTAGIVRSGAEPVNNWWAWLNTVFYSSTDRFVLTGASGFSGSIVRITITGPSPALGALVIGRSVRIGRSLLGGATKVRRRTFTRKDTNEFGDVTVTKRAIARDVTYSIHSERQGFGSKAKLLDAVDGIRVVTFAETGWDEFVNYGFITDWELPAELPNDFILEITNQGVS